MTIWNKHARTHAQFKTTKENFTTILARARRERQTSRRRKNWRIPKMTLIIMYHNADYNFLLFFSSEFRSCSASVPRNGSRYLTGIWSNVSSSSSSSSPFTSLPGLWPAHLESYKVCRRRRRFCRHPDTNSHWLSLLNPFSSILSISYTTCYVIQHESCQFLVLIAKIRHVTWNSIKSKEWVRLTK